MSRLGSLEFGLDTHGLQTWEFFTWSMESKLGSPDLKSKLGSIDLASRLVRSLES